MKLLMIAAPFVVALLGLILTIVIGGLFISREHKASVSIRLSKPPELIWALIVEPEVMMQWRTDVTGVERLPDLNGHPVFKETGGAVGGIAMELVESVPLKRRVTRIADHTQPFGGTWTWELTPEAGGSRLRITEDGFIKPPPFRYIAKIIGYDATMKGFLTKLAKHVGDEGTAIEP